MYDSIKLLNKCAILLSLSTCLGIFSACNSTSFKAQEKQTKTSDSSAGADQTQDPPLSSPNPPPPNDGQGTITKEIHALELFQYNLESDIPLLASQNDVSFESVIENDIPTLVFDKSGHKLNFVPDLQDIGTTFKSQIDAHVEDSNQHLNVTLKVVAPEIKAHECFRQPAPVIGDIAPTLKWHWKGWTDPTTSVNYHITYSSPVAGDLDGDGMPEVVTVASSGDYTTQGTNSYTGNTFNQDLSPVFVLNGQTGTMLWNSFQIAGPGGKKIGALSSTTPAIADLDNDGSPEIIFVGDIGDGVSQRQIYIFNYKTRTLVKTFENADKKFTCNSYCMVSVGDLDGDGKFEIIAGNVVLDYQGNLKFYLDNAESHVSVPIIADIIPSSPGAEIIIGGARIYSGVDGHLIWSTDECSTGFGAVADIDLNTTLDLVCVGYSLVDPSLGSGAANNLDGHIMTFTLNADGTFGKLMWKKRLPRIKPLNMAACYPPAGTPRDSQACRQHGGSPNIGNFDKDPELEVGTAGGAYYVVFKADGTEKWKTETTDWSSTSTGSSLFDLNGDGSVEVLYNDEQKLRIYDGSSGKVIWETANPSGTLWEYPLTVNIDDDPSVEIVVAAPNEGGVKVFEDPTNKWVTSRKLWAQYAYYPEYIDDKLQAVAKPGLPKSGFRVNTQGTVTKPDKILLPDLLVMSPLYFNDKDDSPTLTFLVGNSGEADFNDERGIKIEVFDKNDNKVASEVIKSKIAKGDVTTLTLTNDTLKDLSDTELKVTINKDGDTLISEECVQDNNKNSFVLKSLQKRGK